MAAAMRRLEELMKLIDVVLEVIDARIPTVGANPNLAQLAAKRAKIVVFAKEDLADPATTIKWLTHFNGKNARAVAVNGKEQGSVGKINFHLGQLGSGKTTTRAIVLGIPNSGKSSVINGLLRRTAAKAEDRAGVTRSTQWFRVQPTLELMDTPGILVPKIDSPQAQWMLALTGAIPRERYDPEDVVTRFYAYLKDKTGGRTRVPDLETFATTRGFLRKGSGLDTFNAAQSYIKDFNDGKFGRISFEDPPLA